MAPQLVRLNEGHVVSSFGCGVSALNHFLKKSALLHQSIRYSATFVAVEDGNPQVLGYISLSASCIQVSDFGDDLFLQLKVTQFPMPTLHIGRVAVTNAHKGTGIGNALLNLAIDTALNASEQLGMGVSAVDLWLNDDSLHAYYPRFGFTPVKEGSSHYYLPLGAVRSADKLVEEQGQ